MNAPSIHDPDWQKRDEDINSQLAAVRCDQETPEGMERCEVPIAGEMFVYFKNKEPQRRATAESIGTD